MIGKVIEGRYAGASVNKLTDRNTLFIETDDGSRIALSKNNAISVDDVTEQYPSYGSKVMMVMWNDFETSLIQIGLTRDTQKSEPSSKPYTQTSKVSKSPRKTNRLNHRLFIAAIITVLVFVGIGTAAFVISHKRAEETEAQRALEIVYTQKLDNVKKSARQQVEEIMMNTFIEGGFDHIDKSDMQSIIDNMTVSYSDEYRDGDYFSLTATYCYIIGDIPQYAEFFLSGFLSDSKFDLKHIRNYKDESANKSEEVISSDMLGTQPSETEDYKLFIEPVQWIRNDHTYRYDLLITNWSKEYLEINGTVLFYDKNNTVIGSYPIYIQTIAPDETAFALAVNDTAFDHAEYTLNANVQKYVRSGFDSLEYNVNVVNDNKLVLEITNNGSKKVAIWEADALFYDNGEVIASNLAQYLNGIAPGETIYLTIAANKEFTDYRVFFKSEELSN